MTNDKINFKQYLESVKSELREAMDSSPQLLEDTHIVQSHCKIRVGEDKDSRETLLLRPSEKLRIFSHILEDNTKIPSHLIVEQSKKLDDNHQYPLYWSNKKITEWLNKHTKKQPKT